MIWEFEKSQRVKTLVLEYKLLLIGTILVAGILVWAPTVYANLSTRAKRYDLHKVSASEVPKRKVGIVFGAGIVRATGEPTPYLRNRVKTAANLYREGRVDKLLMTGDNSSRGYSEPEVMRDLAMKLGVSKKDIVLDYAGYNTYDSCYRANKIFNIKSATLVTQGYHLPRAVMACQGMGIETIGVSAVRDGRDFTARYIMREWLSTDKIAIQLVLKPKPLILGEPEPIE